ncbi:twin transmembrane helix small protein [Chitinimonas koreensis]|uniref:twin transmembrane helix small protein n=1 Tax=Chitinimonas koreensis TaxID=356302 RepID=UPI00040CA72F|nr:twin transmembrane helix small protein [Chitinimonas koreensis]QNM96092.1 twin transmembrane helix small protein [Chitinimonas koreensis]
MKIVVVLLIVCILLAMGSALFTLIRHKGASERTVRALTLRVALSIGLFLLLMLAWKLGWTQPHPVG